MLGRWEKITEDSSDEDIEAFFYELMQVVDDYIEFPKPRGKGGAPFINECTSSILSGFKVLGRLERMDWALEILNKLEKGKEHLKGPSYELWIMHLKGQAKGNNAQQCKRNYEALAKLRPDLYG